MADDRTDRRFEIAGFHYRLIAEALELSGKEALSAVLSRIAAATHSDVTATFIPSRPRRNGRLIRLLQN